MSTPRYLALAGDSQALRHWLGSVVPSPHDPQRLDRVLDGETLVIFASPETPLVRLEDDKGLLIGRLFRGTVPSVPVDLLTAAEGRHALWSRGKTLLEGKWGSYVAFLQDEDALLVLRDPSGAVPAYFCEAEGLQIYFSDPELLEALRVERGNIDKEFLRQWLTFPFLRTDRTGICGRSELLPGTLRRTTNGRSSVETAWTPWRAAAGDQIRDFDEAASRVRDVALATVPAQLSGTAPVLELSGGLDSSIVAACLRSACKAFTAANFVTAMPDGDERDYARLVASAVGVELIELPQDELPLDLSPAPRRALRPPLSPVLQPLHRAFARHARSAEIDDFVTGAGGDNLFCYITTAAPILDAARELGIRSALATVQDVATVGDCTLWKALSFAIRKALRQSRRPPWKRDERFLAPGAIAATSDPHLWLERPAGAPSGKIEHVESLVLLHHFIEPRHVSGEALHHPLINQPLMELCLAIPTWLWLRGGSNRAVARAAFSGLLPPEVIRRRTKGRLESMCARAYAGNRLAIAELLLDGELSWRELIDRPALESYLRIEGRPPDEAYYRVFDLVSLELWLRSWRG